MLGLTQELKQIQAQPVLESRYDVEFFLRGFCKLTGSQSRGSRLAHCHVFERLICVDYPQDPLVWRDDWPTIVALHEIAHAVLPPFAKHGPYWRAKFRGLLLDWGYSPTKEIVKATLNVAAATIATNAVLDRIPGAKPIPDKNPAQAPFGYSERRGARVRAKGGQLTLFCSLYRGCSHDHQEGR